MTILGNSVVSKNVGGAFSPDDISDLVGWFDADAITGLSDGNGISQWDDESGNGNHAEQSTSSEQPTYETNELNSKPIVRFTSSSSQAFDLPDSIISTDSSFHIFIVASCNDWDSTLQTLMGLGVANGDSTIIYSVGDQGVSFDHGDDAYITSSALSDSTFYIISCGYDNSSNTLEGFVDGVSQGTDTDAGTGTQTSNSIGSYRRTLWFWDGDIAEVIMYEKALNSTERQNVETYLEDKWGL